MNKMVDTDKLIEVLLEITSVIKEAVSLLDLGYDYSVLFIDPRPKKANVLCDRLDSALAILQQLGSD